VALTWEKTKRFKETIRYLYVCDLLRLALCTWFDEESAVIRLHVYSGREGCTETGIVLRPRIYLFKHGRLLR